MKFKVTLHSKAKSDKDALERAYDAFGELNNIGLVKGDLKDSLLDYDINQDGKSVFLEVEDSIIVDHSNIESFLRTKSFSAEGFVDTKEFNARVQDARIEDEIRESEMKKDEKSFSTKKPYVVVLLSNGREVVLHTRSLDSRDSKDYKVLSYHDDIFEASEALPKDRIKMADIDGKSFSDRLGNICQVNWDGIPTMVEVTDYEGELYTISRINPTSPDQDDNEMIISGSELDEITIMKGKRFSSKATDVSQPSEGDEYKGGGVELEVSRVSPEDVTYKVKGTKVDKVLSKDEFTNLVSNMEQVREGRKYSDTKKFSDREYSVDHIENAILGGLSRYLDQPVEVIWNTMNRSDDRKTIQSLNEFRNNLYHFLKNNF